MLLGVLAALGWRSRLQAPAGATALADEELRRAVIDRLVEESAGIFDSHPDAEVARVLQPGLEDRPSGKIRVSTNSRGMREREYAVPKPAGLVRVVVLGDSFVFGNGVAHEERLGAFLETALAERASAARGPIEVLSFGVASWDVRAACAYLRRQLSLLDPDLVVHVTVSNDLDDSLGVRGFGALARFSPGHPERAGGVVTSASPWDVGFRGPSLLEAGLDHESTSRYRAAADAMLELAEAVEERGGGYLALFFWPGVMPVVEERIAARLGASRVAYVSSVMHEKGPYRISAADNHWSRAGNEKVAQMVYGIVRDRGLLRGVRLGAWRAADAAVIDLHEAGRVEAQRPAGKSPLLAGREVLSRIDFGALHEAAAAQVYGGLDAEGFASPYASLVLASSGARRLRVTGHGLDRPEIGGEVRVYLEEEEVLVLSQAERGPFTAEAEIPASLAGRLHLSVRFAASDYGYAGPALDRCVAFRLGSVELVP